MIEDRHNLFISEKEEQDNTPKIVVQYPKYAQQQFLLIALDTEIIQSLSEITDTKIDILSIGFNLFVVFD